MKLQSGVINSIEYLNNVLHFRCNRQLVQDCMYRVTQLVEKHVYEYRVAAENRAGMGNMSEASELIMASDPICKIIGQCLHS